MFVQPRDLSSNYGYDKDVLCYNEIYLKLITQIILLDEYDILAHC